jgi:phosphatidylinositol alpha-1,6-mannosyltransferase
LTGIENKVLNVERVKIPNNFYGECVYGFLHLLRKTKEKHDYVLVTEAMAQVAASMGMGVLPKKYGVVVHGSEIFIHAKSKMRKRLFSRFLRKSNDIVCVSNYAKKKLIEEYDIDEKKCRVAEFGLTSDWLKKGSSKKVSMANDKNEFTILTVSRITPRKGHDIVIRSIPYMRRPGVNAKYVVVGKKTSYKDNLESIARKNGVRENITFEGAVPEEKIKNYYDNADVFVMPSRREGSLVEGLGISFLEANSRGLPAIGGYHGGVPEAIIDGETGFLVDPTSPKDLADAVVKLASNSDLLLKMSIRARERIAEKFTINSFSKRISEVLK